MSIHSVKEIMESLARGETKPSEWTLTALTNIQKHDAVIGAFLTTSEDAAMAHARSLDETTPQIRHPLFGVPYAAKDNLCTTGIRTTAGSRILENYTPPYSATVVNKLNTAGAVMVGKTNMDEFGMGSSTENSAYKKTKNPHDVRFVPGGSSGGSAAAVAAGMVPFALGSDTGGSIRQPAAFCGVVGVKPSYGRVSRSGLIAYASSLDQIGPLTRSVEDAAYVLEAICGHDPLDSTTAHIETPHFTSCLQGGVKGLRIGIVKDIDERGLSAPVKDAVDKAIRTLENLGAEIVDISLPHSRYAVASYYLIAPSEASSNLSRYDGVRFGARVDGDSLAQMYEQTRSSGFGMEVKRRIMLGTYALSSGYYDAYYKRAQKMRTLIRQDFDEAFQVCDVILTPTAPTTAFAFGEKSSNPLEMYLNDIYTIPASLAGLPGISVPCGMAEGLPIGVQLLGKPFDEATLLRVAYTYESERGFDVPLARLEAE